MREAFPLTEADDLPALVRIYRAAIAGKTVQLDAQGSAPELTGPDLGYYGSASVTRQISGVGNIKTDKEFVGVKTNLQG